MNDSLVLLHLRRFAICIVALLFLTVGIAGQDEWSDIKDGPSTATATPEYQMALHNIGKLVFGVSNWGQLANGDIGRSYRDPFTGYLIPDCQYPKNTRTKYLYKGGIWVGGIIGDDTLVSTACNFNDNTREFNPEEYPFGDIVRRSLLDEPSAQTSLAHSQQDFESVFFDTLVYGTRYLSFDYEDGRVHQPMNIRITLKSYAWSYDYADDFVIFEIKIKNISQDDVIENMYVGVYMDPDSHEDVRNTSATTSSTGKPPTDGDDDLAGFLYSYPASNPDCGLMDTIKTAWSVDNDGDPENATDFIVPGITGIRFLNPSTSNKKLSFNWWVYNYNPSYDFGPQTRDQYRAMGNGIGTPRGDKNKYHMMSNGETDYDMVYTYQIGPADPVWVYPRQPYAQVFTRGQDVQYLMSLGPYDLGPGSEYTIPFAYIGGENFHQWYRNYRTNLRRSYRPDAYYRNSNFKDFANNAVWSSWVYDNPGIDTDTDGYAGKYVECCDGSYCEKFYYEGDGVPDLVGSSPPPAPKFWLETDVSTIRIRWNGLKSETTPDIFSRKYDFEGYRVYIARDDRETSYSLLASYDIEDYRKYVFNIGKYDWDLVDTVFTLEDLRCLYGDSSKGDPCNDTLFDPTIYTRGTPYIMGDSMFYFVGQDFNRYIFGNYPNATTTIRKIYPDQPYPSTYDPELADPSELTEDGYFKYFEYEYTIENLLPTVFYYVNVTAFDYGSPTTNLGPLESSRIFNSQQVYPLTSCDSVAANNLKVYVYPNPYRINGNYIEDGYEGRDAVYYIPDRMRRLNFANLPPKCTIGIYSLDGDLIREFEHDKDPDDPTAMQDSWDLITRNTQRIVTGIYYWVVQEPNGETQIGKFVLIM